MTVNLDLSAEQLLQVAKKKLGEKDLLGFVGKINVVIDRARNNNELLAAATFLQAKGLKDLNQFKNAIEAIDEALQYNTGKKAFELKKYKGIATGYLGNVDESTKVFRELLDETDDPALLVGVYICLAWVFLTLDRQKINDNSLEEAKKYLDMANEYFEDLSAARKWVISNNLGIYHYYKEEYENSIEILLGALRYCSEEELADAYANIASSCVEVEYYAQEDIEEYLNKAEILANKYKNYRALGYVFYTRAMLELREDQFFTALDTLYLALEYMRTGECYPDAFDCLVKINELLDTYKAERLTVLKNGLKEQFKGTPYYTKL